MFSKIAICALYVGKPWANIDIKKIKCLEGTNGFLWASYKATMSTLWKYASAVGSYLWSSQDPVELRSVPRTAQDAKEDALRIGLFSANATSVAETPRGKLLDFLYTSSLSGRPIGHSFMILLGNSGVGKSSTVNHLLGINLASTSRDESETHATTEYKIMTEDESTASSDLTLSVIDTPGFKDTDGPEQTACNIHSIRQMMEEHPSLRGKLPNCILVFHKGSDLRYKGEHSDLSKSLRVISRLDIVDTRKPNVVVAVTWGNALTKQHKADMADNIRNIVWLKLGVEAPIVFIENNKEGLRRKGDSTQMQDGTWQPGNLLIAITEMMDKADDPFGQLCIAKFFQEGGQKTVRKEEGFSVPATVFARVKQLNGKEAEILDDLKSDDIRAPEVIQKARDYLRKESDMSDAQRHSVRLLSHTLAEDFGLKTVAEVGQYSTQQIDQMMERDLTPFEKAFVEELYDVKPGKNTSLNLDVPVGKGYNIITDSTIPSAIFEIDRENLQEAPYGLQLPPGIQMSKVNRSSSHMDHFKEEGQYVNHRLNQLRVSMSVDPSLFKMRARAGFSRDSTSAVKETYNHVERSYLFERKLFKLDMPNWRQDFKLTKGFADAVKNQLPAKYDKNNANVRKAYEDFFNTWGHFLVASAYGGGSMEARAQYVGTAEGAQAELDIRAEMDAALFFVSGNTSYSSPQRVSGSNRSILGAVNMSWIGGDGACHAVSPSENSNEKWGKWQASLTANPEMLTTEMYLIPMHTLLEDIAPEKMIGCRDALEDFLGGQFKVVSRREEDKRLKEEKAKIEQQKKKQSQLRKDIGASAKPFRKKDCFPSSSLVVTKDGISKEMEDLQVGEEVLAFDRLSGKLLFSEVYMFAHLNQNDVANYSVITTTNRKTIRLSASHLIFVGTESLATKFAGDVKHGDVVWTHDGCGRFSRASVAKVEQDVPLRGFFAPITTSGTIVVDGVLASCYATLDSWMGLDGHDVCHAGLWPFRTANALAGVKFDVREGDEDGMPAGVKWINDNILPWLQAN